MSLAKCFCLLFFVATALAPAHRAIAEGEIAEITLNGSYSRTRTTYKITEQKSYGAEIAIPLTTFLDVSAGHTIVAEETRPTDALRESYKLNGMTILEKENTAEALTFTNVNLGYPIGFLKPTIFGGALWRRSCYENSIQNYGCRDDKMTWNAGLALSVLIHWKLRLRISTRISPSVTEEEVGEKKWFDQLTSVGLTWSI